MKLAVFTSRYPGRVTTFFERDMRALLEAGVELDVFSIYPLDTGYWECSPGILGEDVLPRHQVRHLGGLESLRRLRPWPLRTATGFLRDAASAMIATAPHGPVRLAKTGYVVPKAWAWAQDYSECYDHVLAYWGNYAATCAYLFHRASRRPIPFSIWLHAGTDLYLRRPFLRQKLRYADCIITCCEFNRRFIHDQYPDLVPSIQDRIHVTYHGLDLSEFPYAPGGRPPDRILGVGRLSGFKGWRYLLQAVAELRHSGIHAQLDLLGDGKQRADLERLVRELGIEAQVHLHGWVPFERVRTAMSQATVVVHPSEGLGDGLPNVIREAMALGTPVIASDVAGIPEALDGGRCGLLVPPRDVPSLARALAQLLGDEPLRLRLAARARSLTEAKFDVWKNGAGLADLLRTASETRGAGGRATPRAPREIVSATEQPGETGRAHPAETP